jgi:hypothetical protein
MNHGHGWINRYMYVNFLCICFSSGYGDASIIKDRMLKKSIKIGLRYSSYNDEIPFLDLHVDVGVQTYVYDVCM